MAVLDLEPGVLPPNLMAVLDLEPGVLPPSLNLMAVLELEPGATMCCYVVVTLRMYLSRRDPKGRGGRDVLDQELIAQLGDF